MALFDLSSTWMTGSRCELAARGYSRDGKKGLPQIPCVTGLGETVAVADYHYRARQDHYHP